MGKIPPSLRSSQFPVNPIIKSPPPSDTVTKPFKPYYVSPKNSNKKPSPKSIDMIKYLPNPNIIPAFPSSDLSAAKSFIDSLSISSFNPKSHNSLLRSYVATSPSSSDAFALLRHILSRHPALSPDRNTYHILLSLACSASLSSVRKTLSLMASEGFPPDKSSVDVSVRSLCAVNRLDEATEMVKEFCHNNCSPDDYTYNFLLKRLCKDRDLMTVNSFITEMRESFNVKPDLISYTILIDNVCNRKNLREATHLLDLLAQDGFKPDLYLYNTIMKGYCVLGQGGELLGVLRKMKEQGVEPDLVTYNTLIFGLSKCGRVKEARRFLNLMAEEGHFPDEVTYTSLMNGMCRERDTHGAVDLLGEMEAKGCVPNSCTYNTLLQGLCKERMMEKAVEFFNVMKVNGMKLESGSYGAYLRALCKIGKVAEAYEVFDYAVESKSMKDIFAYSTLESTLKWLKKAREQGLAV